MTEPRMRSAVTEEQSRVLEAVCLWATTAAAAGCDVFAGGPDQFAANVWHSALLRRLLEGKQPEKEPPPTAFSYPVYGFEDGSIYFPTECWRPTQNGADPAVVVVVDQSGWRVLEGAWPVRPLVVVPLHRNGGTGTTRYVLFGPIRDDAGREREWALQREWAWKERKFHP